MVGILSTTCELKRRKSVASPPASNHHTVDLTKPLNDFLITNGDIGSSCFQLNPSSCLRGCYRWYRVGRSGKRKDLAKDRAVPSLPRFPSPVDLHPECRRFLTRPSNPTWNFTSRVHLDLGEASPDASLSRPRNATHVFIMRHRTAR